MRYKSGSQLSLFHGKDSYSPTRALVPLAQGASLSTCRAVEGLDPAHRDERAGHGAGPPRGADGLKSQKDEPRICTPGPCGMLGAMRQGCAVCSDRKTLAELFEHSPCDLACLRRYSSGLLITGAADDDPSGIATYSQAGAQAGLNMLWPFIFTYPLLVAVQTVSARIGRVTGEGLAMNMRRLFPAWLAYAVVSLLVFANTINIAADIAAMGSSAASIGCPARHTRSDFGASSALQVFMPISATCWF